MFAGVPADKKGHGSGQGEDRHGGSREASRFAAHELSSQDRLSGQVTAQVFGQGGDRCIALCGPFLPPIHYGDSK